MKTLSIALILFALVLIPGCKQSKQSSSDIWNLAVERKSDLRLSVYVTAQTVEQMFTTETGRREVVSLLRCNGITKVYMEVYRSGLVISPEVIRSSVLFLKENRFEVVGEPKLFDGVWVGTETRGQFTQRFGFVQPYEGFINFRWISTLAGNKIGGAWFDHGDCTDNDFIEQAYQSVLAGAKELVIFNFDSFVTGNPGHHLLRQDFEHSASTGSRVC